MESKKIAIALWLNAILLVKESFNVKLFLKIINATRNNQFIS